MKTLAPIIFGLIICIFIYQKLINPRKKFEDLALGEGTVSYYAQKNGYPIHLSKLCSPELIKFKEGWIQRGRKELVLIIGNSQTHSINQYKQGEVTYGEILFDSLNHKIDILTISYPNANLQEFYITIRYFVENFPIKMVILPVFFDDMRETGLREVYLPELIESKYTWKSTSEIDKVLIEEISELGLEKGGDYQALDKTTQEYVEEELNNYATTYSELWRKRPGIRGEIFNGLYRLRNWVLGIKPNSIRRKIHNNYNLNIESLISTMNLCDTLEITTVIYIPPIRDDVPLPYDMSEYVQFKEDMFDSPDGSENVNIFNFEHIIPGKYWGVKQSTGIDDELEIDYMHFQYEGHKILADSLLNVIQPLIK